MRRRTSRRGATGGDGCNGTGQQLQLRVPLQSDLTVLPDLPLL